MSSRRRKKKPNGKPAVPPARNGKLALIVAVLLGACLVATVVVLNLPGREPESANNVAPAPPVNPTSAVAGEAPSRKAIARENPSPEAVPAREAGAASPSKDLTPATPAAAVSDATRGFDVLKGRWLRPDSDGRYVVEVRSVDESGKMDAAYFNPKRINASKAEASRDGATTKVFIELRDANYPGSTYNLVYEPENDQLHGVYYQAALDQRFEVVFVRMR